MIKAFWSLYRPQFSTSIVYMLQNTEYQAGPYLKWLWRVSNFNRVMYRRELVPTRAAVLLHRVLRLGIFAQQVVAIILIVVASRAPFSLSGVILAAALGLSAPLVWAHLVVAPLWLGRWLVIKPLYAYRVWQSRKIFKNHPGVRVAIAGSYGKTTMKEILLHVLSEGKKVAATPSNRNVAISHANFARNLTGDEEILIIEYGEGRPGDIARFARATHPNIGIITGLAPAHLDKYKNLEAAAKDIMSLANLVEGGEVYVSGESAALKPYIKKPMIRYSSKGLAGWKVSNVKLSVEGLKFTMKKGQVSLVLNSGLVGRHLIAPVALAAYFAYEAGLSKTQIEKAVAALKPFEHRMQPYRLANAWIIDDTYNGNIDGMRAGLELLAELKAKRKIYITPGLVDQGVETKSVHVALGEFIAKAQPDILVLMKNSVTDYIKEGLGDFKGELIEQNDPLDFYTHLDKFVAAGDLVLMQNDWTDNYR